VALRNRIQNAVPIGVEGSTPFWLRLLYGGAITWIFVATYLANLATRALLLAL
jgi:hypothetical protein